MSSMQVVPLLRRELARQLLTEIGRRIAFDAVPTRLQRSRAEHLRNGVGGLLATSGGLVFRSGPATVFRATRKKARTELRYAVGEIVRAGRPETQRQRVALVAAAAGVAIGVAAALRARRGGAAAERPTDPVEGAASLEPVAAGVAE
jgi:hypothetical protein